MKQGMVNKKKKKRRIVYKRLLLVILSLILLCYLIYYLFQIPISHIRIHGNFYLSDQGIIEMAHLEDYPSTFQNTIFQITDQLEKNLYIEKVQVQKKWLTQVWITVRENRPLFYNSVSKKTILMSGDAVDVLFEVPTLVNYTPDTKYQRLLKEMKEIDMDILKRISEIKYDPNEVDDSRFLLSMDDGNYVYLTLYKFQVMNDYLSIIKNFPNKRGILYLDAGNSFKIMEE